jgi:hypothetical protein
MKHFLALVLVFIASTTAVENLRVSFKKGEKQSIDKKSQYKRRCFLSWYGVDSTRGADKFYTCGCFCSRLPPGATLWSTPGTDMADGEFVPAATIATTCVTGGGPGRFQFGINKRLSNPNSCKDCKDPDNYTPCTPELPPTLPPVKKVKKVKNVLPQVKKVKKPGQVKKVKKPGQVKKVKKPGQVKKTK